MALKAFEREVPPLKTRCSPNGALNMTASVQTTHTSFSNKCKGRPPAVLATSSASSRSLAESSRNLSAIRDKLTHLFSNPFRNSRPRSCDLAQLCLRQLLLEPLHGL